MDDILNLHLLPINQMLLKKITSALVALSPSTWFRSPSFIRLELEIIRWCDLRSQYPQFIHAWVCLPMCVLSVTWACLWVRFWPLTYALSSLLSQSTLHPTMEINYPVSLLAANGRCCVCMSYCICAEAWTCSWVHVHMWLLRAYCICLWLFEYAHVQLDSCILKHSVCAQCIHLCVYA